MTNKARLGVIAMVLAGAASAALFVTAGESKSTGYSVEVSLQQEAGGQYLARATVRGAGNAVLAAPALKAKVGTAAQAESAGPDGSPRVTFTVAMGGPTETADYEVEVFEGDVRVAHHKAQVALGH